jgi:probable F420-dependent oxidoreductase
VKLGVFYPTNEVAGDARATRRFVEAVDRLGYDYLSAPDHVLKVSQQGRPKKLFGHYDETHPFHDPFVLFGFAAGISERLEFNTSVLVLPQRQTALVAQQAADIALLSNERFRLGVGIGWNYVEYAALGQDFASRAARVEEQIALLRRLWTEPLLTFEGRFDHIDRAAINPRPKRPIPVWLGGWSEPAYERAARLADGFIFAATADGALEALGRVTHHLGANGRPVASFGRELLAFFTGDVEDSAGQLNAWRDAGGTHGCLCTQDKGFGADVEAHIDFMGRVRERL